ncbi:MoxR family ATPase [Paenibacillus alvei]|uniref:MoxR family ATPase n=1 Tax=Paenibacillus alvei TaxID=44250 RepID=A0ABT4GUS1_PAEAL|nr:MoxR family ATPase [Paenibacillus alvei]EJW17288.1 ATPase associated with various cellular activities AAA_3 [Paenibacillus alvei DSM 29]MCY9542894.1 MoxR family ATPase [Paenibacillus alvei]MCY9706928.1 MoxR family ATPase [Paenibacillus alvei]MCY9735146.1 MoxR family ATPase [Paenibacillus alvei]MCY9753350.1 MoxR family ATPase [Paenibacillus alvei]
MSSHQSLHSIMRKMQATLERCILGKSREIELLLTAMLAGGHVLIEDVPGTGKTQLVKSLARTMNGIFRRVQCNPDLLPTDITGVFVFHPKDQQFVYRPGPIMANVLLVDEINRATTKTQSALLEAMEEHHITVDGETFPLPSPFVMFATQNPIEFEGTYVLPEAQLDRFMFKLKLGYPDEQTERTMLIRHAEGLPSERAEQVTDIDSIKLMQEEVRSIYIDDAVAAYMIDIIRATREQAHVLLGASPRASVALMQAAKARAWIHERNFVTPDDVKELLPFVLTHRIVLRMEAKMDGITAEQIIHGVTERVRVPVRLGT